MFVKGVLVDLLHGDEAVDHSEDGYPLGPVIVREVDQQHTLLLKL